MFEVIWQPFNVSMVLSIPISRYSINKDNARLNSISLSKSTEKSVLSLNLKR